GEAAWKARPPAADPGTTPFDLHGVTFTRRCAPLGLDDIRAFEAEIGFTLTPEYRWLLLQANGGKPVPGLLPGDLFPQHSEDEEGGETEAETALDVRLTFFPLRSGSAPIDPGPAEPEEEVEVFATFSVEEARTWFHDGSSIPRGTVPIGNLN